MSGGPNTPARMLALIVVHHVKFPASQQATAVAVALAESGGQSVTVPDNPRGRTGCTSSGPWQINYCPGRDDGNPHRDPKISNMLDPVVNARAALAISSGGTNWRPWTTYVKGTHRRHLQAAGEAVAWARSPDGKFFADNVKPGAVSGKPSLGDQAELGWNAPGTVAAAAVDALNPLDAIARFLELLTSWDTWRRVLFAVAGLALGYAGVTLLVRDTAISALT